MSEGLILEEAVPKRLFGVRHFQVLLQCIFYIIVFAIQVSFSPSSSLGGTDPFIIGFLITALFGGVICKKYGFKWPMIILMIITSIVTLNFPIAYVSNGTLAFVCRLLQGHFIGLAYSMPADFISRWIPTKERTVLGTAVYASGRLGIALSIIVSINLDYSFGWETIFYQLGYVTLLWALLMAIFGANSPEDYFKDASDSDSELYYIIENREAIIENSKIPCSKILKSLPFWAVIVAQIGASWMLYVLMIKIPNYLYYNYNVKLEDELAYMTPLISWILSFVISGIAQYLINSGKTTIQTSRKIFNSIGTFVPALFLIYLYFEPTGNQYEGIIIWTFISVATIGTICGSTLNSNDISANFSPIVFGTSIWFGEIVNTILGRIIPESLTAYKTPETVFSFTAILLAATNIFYLIFGSGVIQDWDLYEDSNASSAQQDTELSNSSSHATHDEKRFLLYVRKQ